ncbi:MAG: N-acetylmuramoyl-L-alanine amidase [Candidatus Dojkabacteria bacterium]
MESEKVDISLNSRAEFKLEIPSRFDSIIFKAETNSERQLPFSLNSNELSIPLQAESVLQDGKEAVHETNYFQSEVVFFEDSRPRIFVFNLQEVERSEIKSLEVHLLNTFDDGISTQATGETMTLNGVPVVTRRGWGCHDHPDGGNPSTPYYCDDTFWSRTIDPVSHIVVHHTATSNSSSNWAATVRAIWYDHSHVRDADPNDGVQGWTDIGYNFLIDPNGVIYEGRLGGLGSAGGHAKFHNRGTVGIALLGTYSSSGISSAARNSLQILSQMVLNEYELNPWGNNVSISGETRRVMSGHRDWNATRCPGDNLYGTINQLNLFQGIPDSPTDKKPVYRFWSERYRGHFFTESRDERDYVLARDPNWRYEKISFYVKQGDNCDGTRLYRFWSDRYRKHFYTISLEEKNYLEANNRNWEYEGRSICAYNSQVEDTAPVYRFWSDSYNAHFYTISQAEKEFLEQTNNNWRYEGVAYFAYPNY